MKDKEKQIEEMAKVIDSDCYNCKNCNVLKRYKNQDGLNGVCCSAIKKAEEIYELLTKDSVVLSRKELQEHDKKLANDIITMFQTMAQGWASSDIVNDTAKRLRKLYEV